MNPRVFNEPPPLPKKRPLLVEVILAFYAFSVFSTFVSYALMLSESLPASETQKQYFASLSAVDLTLPLLVVGINFTAAVMLFRLMRQAPPLFTLAFVMGLIMVAYQCFTTNWVEVSGILGLVGGAIGWAINIAIIRYAWSLRNRRVLS